MVPPRNDTSRGRNKGASEYENRYHRGQLLWTLLVAAVMIVVAVHYVLTPRPGSLPLMQTTQSGLSGSSDENRKPAFLLFR